MQIVTVELPDAVALRLDAILLENEGLKNQLLKELVIRYIEDVEDGIACSAVLKKNTDTSHFKSLDELAQELHLDD